MTVVTDDKKGVAARRSDRAEAPGARAAAELAASGALDDLFAKIDAGAIELTGDGGFIPGLIKAAVERGLQAELTSHVGYDKGDPNAALNRPGCRGGSDSTEGCRVRSCQHQGSIRRSCGIGRSVW